MKHSSATHNAEQQKMCLNSITDENSINMQTRKKLLSSHVPQGIEEGNFFFFYKTLENFSIEPLVRPIATRLHTKLMKRLVKTYKIKKHSEHDKRILSTNALSIWKRNSFPSMGRFLQFLRNDFTALYSNSDANLWLFQHDAKLIHEQFDRWIDGSKFWWFPGIQNKFPEMQNSFDVWLRTFYSLHQGLHPCWFWGRY